MSPTFTAEIDSDLSPGELKREILTTLSVPLGKSGYQLESESDADVTYAREYRPYAVPAIIFGIFLLFPLVFFFVQRTDRITFSISGVNGKTQLIVVGDGPRALRRSFDELERWD